MACVIAASAAFVLRSALSITKSWMMPSYRVAVTSTPASRSFRPYASPSSRSTSASPVITSALGSPARSSLVARSGEAVISLRWFSSVVYWSQNHSIASRRRK